MTGYVGTYLSPESPGVFRFQLDGERGVLSPARLWLEAPDAKCVAVRGPYTAALVNRSGKAGVLVADRSGAVLDEALPEQRTACFLTWHGAHLLTANYHEGTVLLYFWDGKRLHLEKRLEIAPRAGCHQALVHAGMLLVPCLELDEIRRFDMINGLAPLSTLHFPSGSGPRHGIFRGEDLYLVSERSNELFTLCGPELEIVDVQPIVNGDAATAALRLSPGGRFLYVSTRVADVLTVYRVDGRRPALVQQVPCGGAHPRDFLLTPDGRFLLTANRLSNELAVFPLDLAAGRIGPVRSRTVVPECVGLALEERMI